MHKAFRPIRRDSLLKYTTDFVQQVQVPCQKCKRIHEIWIFRNVIWRPQYVNEQEKKNTRAKTTTDVELLIQFLREKHGQKNSEDIEANELNEYLCKFILNVKRKNAKAF